MGSFVAAIFVLILCIAIMVAISRWVFRINDIVKHLESINAKLDVKNGTDTKRKTITVNPDMPCDGCGHKPMKIITKVDGSTGIECPACRRFYPAT
jgi:hypothetical protein